MKKEFIVERQGRSFVLYAGLLSLAHEQGLKSIRTELVQIPNEANNRVAICTAIVVMEKEGKERVFTGIGDAAPNNVAPAMQTALIRMSETRAKARALRDAVNIGVAAFEELSEEDAHDGAAERSYSFSGSGRNGKSERTPTAPRPPVPASQGRPQREMVAPVKPNAPVASEGVPIPAELRHPATQSLTDAQAEAIRSLCRRHGLDPDATAQEKFQTTHLTTLTQSQASEMIKSLQERNGNVRLAPVAP